MVRGAGSPDGGDGLDWNDVAVRKFYAMDDGLIFGFCYDGLARVGAGSPSACALVGDVGGVSGGGASASPGTFGVGGGDCGLLRFACNDDGLLRFACNGGGDCGLVCCACSGDGVGGGAGFAPIISHGGGDDYVSSGAFFCCFGRLIFCSVNNIWSRPKRAYLFACFFVFGKRVGDVGGAHGGGASASPGTFYDDGLLRVGNGGLLRFACNGDGDGALGGGLLRFARNDGVFGVGAAGVVFATLRGMTVVGFWEVRGFVMDSGRAIGEKVRGLKWRIGFGFCDFAWNDGCGILGSEKLGYG